MTTLLTQARLKNLLHYDPDTGVFSWVEPGKGRRPHVGCPTAAGYLRVRLDGRLHYLHRLAWLWAHGEWPKQHIDHINGEVADNRLCNLRDVSRFVNLQNERKARKHSSSGLLGAHKKGNRWVSRIRVNGAYVHLGAFATAQQAHEVYLAAKHQHHEGSTL